MEELQNENTLEQNESTLVEEKSLFVQKVSQSVQQELSKVIIGQEKNIRLMLAGLFSNGHVLLEGVPGVAKTLMVKMFAKTLSVDFNRIQFTPDLMPSDVIGSMVFNMKNSEFYFREGPIFSNFILIDEINRSPAKTQAALFEVMEERQITIEGKTNKMKFPLFIVATQNPIEQEGTYKLPEAQLDRFLFKIDVDYPTLNQEIEILQRYKEDFTAKQTAEIKAVFTVEELSQCMEIVEKVHIKADLINYIAKIVCDTRENPFLYLGASPRASLSILKTSKAIAAINGRDFVTPDDIKEVAVPVLNHRVILNPEKEIEGVTCEEVIAEILRKNEIPR